MILELFTRQKWGGKKSKKSPDLFNWFSMCSQTYSRMIKDLDFIYGL
jgi:hypothetical protein